MFLCLRGKRNAETPHDASPHALMSPRQRPVPKFLKNMFYSTNLQNIHPKTWHIHK